MSTPSDTVTAKPVPTPHAWIEEEVDGGPALGKALFWRCTVCRADGGPSFGDRPVYRPFLAGTGMYLGEDCVAAKKLTDVYHSTFGDRIERHQVRPKEIMAFRQEHTDVVNAIPENVEGGDDVVAPTLFSYRRLRRRST